MHKKDKKFLLWFTAGIGSALGASILLLRQSYASDYLNENTAEPFTLGKYGEQSWLVANQLYPSRILSQSDTKLILPYAENGCNLEYFGHFRPRHTSPRILMLHWGGKNPSNLCSIFQSKSRPVSSHGCIGKDFEGNTSIHQFLDLHMAAFHAGSPSNDVSIGLDIAQEPTTNFYWYYKNLGYDIQTQNNPTGRGPSECLTLDSSIKKATQEAVLSICDIYKIPLKIPRGFDGQQDQGEIYYGQLDDAFIKYQFSGILGHFHAHPTRWDIAPWWEDVVLPLVN